MRASRGEVERRLRSFSVLNSEEIAASARQGIELGYDPVQHGFVRLDCIDDITPVPIGGKAPAATQFRGDRDLIRFRRWLLDDAPAFLDLLGNPRVWRYLPDAPREGLDLAKAADLIRFSNEAEHHEVFAVEVDGDIVGQVRLLFDPSAFDRSTAEISYWFGEGYWRRGLGTKVVRSFTVSSFSKWPSVRSIFARVHRDNLASQRVLLKAGYQPEDEAAGSEWRIFRVFDRTRHSPDTTSSF